MDHKCKVKRVQDTLLVSKPLLKAVINAQTNGNDNRIMKVDLTITWIYNLSLKVILLVERF